jgi:hypothetical protein
MTSFTYIYLVQGFHSPIFIVTTDFVSREDKRLSMMKATIKTGKEKRGRKCEGGKKTFLRKAH